MKRLVFGVLVLICGAFGYTPVQAATTNSFTISSYAADISLSRDNENRSVATVTETITAEFPSYDQNHGLERAFVKEYNGHSLSFDLTSVTDASGKALAYHWDGDNLRIGDADTYVHGQQIYVIGYTMRDVTRYYSDTGRDEFYWDVIGTDWQVPITIAIVNLTIDSSLESVLTGDRACYRGVSGSTMTCELSRTDSGYGVQAANLAAGEGVTVVFGFKPQTFTAYQPSFFERLAQVWAVVQFVASPAAIIIGIWFLIRWTGKMSRRKEQGTVVPEYLPPKEASVTTSAKIGGYLATSVMTAQMLDFAVRHYIRIYEVKEKGLFSPAEYEIEVIKDISDLRLEEQELLQDTFGSLPSVGQRLNLKKLKNNTAYYARTLNNDSDLTKLIRGEYGLQEHDEAAKAWSRKVALMALIVAVVLVSMFWAILALVAFAVSFVCWRLSDKGLALDRYLKGLKMYIKVAEEERIRMLQSPDGAEKVASVATGTDSAQLIKLYEKALPYAVLFGQEKQWNSQLGRYYETTQSTPDWYTGQTVFNAAVFSSAMSSFSQANTYASSSSSGSGGSGGGGFSGGGGGGGGGGGW